MNITYFPYLVTGVSTLLLSLIVILYYRKKYCLGELKRENDLETIAIMAQLKLLFESEDNKEIAHCLAEGAPRIYILPDYDLGKTPEEEKMISQQIDKLDEYLSILGLCGMLYKTGSVTPKQMISLVGERLGDIRDNEHLFTYIHTYSFRFQDLIYLLDKIY